MNSPDPAPGHAGGMGCNSVLGLVVEDAVRVANEQRPRILSNVAWSVLKVQVVVAVAVRAGCAGVADRADHAALLHNIVHGKVLCMGTHMEILVGDVGRFVIQRPAVAGPVGESAIHVLLRQATGDNGEQVRVAIAGDVETLVTTRAVGTHGNHRSCR